MEPNQPRSRRLRLRLSTLVLLVIIAALILSNLVQLITNERQRRLTEQALQDATAAQQKARVVIDQYLSQIPEQSPLFKPEPKPEPPPGAQK